MAELLRTDYSSQEGFYSEALGWVPSVADALLAPNDASRFQPSNEQLRYAQLELDTHNISEFRGELSGLKDALRNYNVAFGYSRDNQSIENNIRLDETSYKLNNAMQRGMRGIYIYLHRHNPEGRVAISHPNGLNGSTGELGQNLILLRNNGSIAQVMIIPDGDSFEDYKKGPMTVILQSVLNNGVVDFNLQLRLAKYPSASKSQGVIFHSASMHNPPERIETATSPDEQLASAMPFRSHLWDAVSVVEAHADLTVDVIAAEQAALESIIRAS